jgi:hypothetical protein
MYSSIPIHWNIKSAPASLGRSRAGPVLTYLASWGQTPFSMYTSDYHHARQKHAQTHGSTRMGHWLEISHVILKKCYFSRLKINHVTTVNVCAFVLELSGTNANTNFTAHQEILKCLRRKKNLSSSQDDNKCIYIITEVGWQGLILLSRCYS